MARSQVGTTVYGNAIKFVSASSQYASRTKVSTASDNVTAAFWLYIDALPASTKYVFQNGDGPNHFGYEIQLLSTGQLVCDMVFVNASCKTTTLLSAGQWYHVVFQRSGGTSQFYLNGVADGATSSSTWNTVSATSTTGIGTLFTSSGTPSGTNYSDVTMDDIRYYNRAITTGEITSLYNYGIDINNGDIANTSMVLWWKADESSGNLIDSSGGGNTGTNGNSATFVTGKVMSSHTPARSATATRTAAVGRSAV